MKEYEFTLMYLLPASDLEPAIYVEALAEAGCDDALIGIGRSGRIALEFIREDKSAAAAITRALEQVKATIPGAQLIEATPDFVGLTDVADIIGCSRQNMRKLVQANMHSFPAPVHEGKASIWHLFSVLNWLSDRDNYDVDLSIIEVSKTAMEINTAKQVASTTASIDIYRALI